MAHAQPPGDFAHPTNARQILPHAARHLQDEHEHLGDRLVELDRDFVSDLDLRQRGRKTRVLFDGHAVGARGLDDLVADGTAAFGDDHWRSRLLIMKRYGKRDATALAHDARSRKRPAGLAGCGRGGEPSRTSTSPGSSSACFKASDKSDEFSRSLAAAPPRSAQSVTAVREPISATCACTAPIGSTSSVKRARHTGLMSLAGTDRPSREISNWAMAVLPCGVANGTSKFQRGPDGSPCATCPA